MGKGLVWLRPGDSPGRTGSELPGCRFRGSGACLALYGIFRWCHERLEFWQVLVLFALTPYLILNYGFDNLAVGAGGVPVPVGEALLFAALALLLGRQWWIVRSITAESSVV